MAAVAVPRLLVNRKRTGGAAAVEVHIGDTLSCNRPLYGQPPGLRGAKARKPAREELEFETKHRYVDNFLHVSYAETSVHTAG